MAKLQIGSEATRAGDNVEDSRKVDSLTEYLQAQHGLGAGKER